MSSDDSDTDHGDAEASQSGADSDGGGQPRDPETGQFLPKDERGAAATDEGATASDADRDDSAKAREPPGSGPGRESDTQRPGSVPRSKQPLRITRVPVRSGAGPPHERAVPAPPDPVLPPSLHLVPMQVQSTGEPVRVEPSTGRPVALHRGTGGAPR